MVLGLRSKNRKGASVPVDYIVLLEEIRPWPPSQSLKSLRSVLLQWKNGERSSGSTSAVAPSAQEGKIEFNESFKLHVTLLKDASGRGNDKGPFQKNVLELNLYEPRRDKTVKGQLLASASVDLAEHGVIKEPVTIRVPVNCKRSFRNTAQPVLYVKIQPYDDGSSSSSRECLSKEASMDRDVKESVSALMADEYSDEAEIASFTDDDDSSLSSQAHPSAWESAADSPLQNSPGNQTHHEDLSEAVKQIEEVKKVAINLPLEPKPDLEPVTDPSNSYEIEVQQSGPLLQSDQSVDPESLDNGDASSSNPPQTSSVLIIENSNISGVHLSSSITFEATDEGTGLRRNEQGIENVDLSREVLEEKISNNEQENLVIDNAKKENDIGETIGVKCSDTDIQKEEVNLTSNSEANTGVDEDAKPQERLEESEVSSSNGAPLVSEEGNIDQKQIEHASKLNDEDPHNDSTEIGCLTDNTNSCSDTSVTREANASVVNQQSYVQDELRKQLLSDVTTLSHRVLGERGNKTLTSDRLKNMFSVRSTTDSLESTTYSANDQYVEDVKEMDVQKDVRNGGMYYKAHEQGSTRLSADKLKHFSRNSRNSFPINKVKELEHRVEVLEGELRGAAAIEIGLYSVVAEHGSSPNKVHTPARRLSRLYIHASKQSSQEKRASAARSAISGLVVAAKACGNDVPRLSFWLSNLVVLRTIISQSTGRSECHNSSDPYPAANGSSIRPKKKSSPLKWESPRKNEKFSFNEDSDDWENPIAFLTALERIETWIFSRISESIWWQTFVPHMQLINEDRTAKARLLLKSYEKISSSSGQQHEKSVEIWKKAFMDARERLCPVRGGGHDCGCMPMLARLAMEQCVARLDVAMFNAILRESDDQILADPVSDPIIDSRVLPISSEELSFGAGAQLKNAIGNWSRWLTDIFGMDTDESPENDNEKDDERLDVAACFKSFRLLNALSDLLMLPKDLLLEGSIRKEVCPTFNASMIKRILQKFSPDEFCPDQIPDTVLEALDSEDPLEKNEDGIRSLPSNASPINYSPPSVASVESVIGDVNNSSPLKRSRSSVVRKCHTSEDELDELDSPLSSIRVGKPSVPIAKLKGNGGTFAVRYQLLREVWRCDD